MPRIAEISTAIKYATSDQKKDPDFMLNSIRSASKDNIETVSEEVMKHAHPDLKKDQKFLLRVIEAATYIDPSKIMEYIPSNLKNDPEFMFNATERNPRAVKCIGIFLKSNPAFMSELAKKVSY